MTSRRALRKLLTKGYTITSGNVTIVPENGRYYIHRIESEAATEKTNFESPKLAIRHFLKDMKLSKKNGEAKIGKKGKKTAATS